MATLLFVSGKMNPLLAALVAAFIVASVVPVVHVGATGGPDSGIYTEEQADRGQQLYTTRCSWCHRDDLTGGGADESGPPLVGPRFSRRWNGRSVAELVITVVSQMPKDTPGSLTDEEYVDIVAHILRTNGMPAGSQPLPVDQTLEQLHITLPE